MNNSKSLCFITNIGAHYRFSIFSAMGKAFACHFYLGNKVETPIKTFDYDKLEGYRQTLKNIYLGHFYWQRGSVRLIFKPYHYYIVDGEPFCLSSWAILLFAKLMGKKTIAWTHGWYGREGKAKRLIKKCFFSLHSALMVYSEYAIGLMQKEGIPRSKMYCIANSMDSDRERAIREQLACSDIYRQHFLNDNPTIIYCGRIQKLKRLELLVDCAAAFKEEGRPVNIVFVGKDVEQVHIDQYAKDKNVADSVWMYGPCYDDEVLGQLFYNAHVCVSPGNVGLTAIHSLTFGCPVVTHNNFAYQMPEFESIRQGETGTFFEQGNAKSLKQEIEYWICADVDKREQTRRKAFDEIDRKWNIHYQLEVIKKVLNET